MTLLSVVILTGNEEANIAKCLRSVEPLGARVYVVDSLSTDRTVDIARSMGATVLSRAWTNHADQFNWALEHAAIDTPWTMRMDADEEVTPGLARHLPAFLLGQPADVTGVHLRRRVYFMGRWIRHGGYYPTWLLRVFRTGKARCEARLMDEHLVVSEGRSVSLAEDIIDRNEKDLTFWTQKHNAYATLEMRDVLGQRDRAAHATTGLEGHASGAQAAARRWVKQNLYLRAPLFVRPCAYFFYRYVLRLGFLDGRRGLVFHFLQGFWYRFLVDAKLYEHERRDARHADT